MAEEQSTHVIYKGRHYVLPGKLTPEDSLVRVRNLTGGGPKIRTNTGPSPVGFEDTSADAAAVLERNVEPNRARDVLPKLAMFAAEGALAGVPAGVAGAISKGVQSLRGLSTAAKVGKVATGGAKLGAEGVGYWAADRALAMAGVPPEYRAIALMAAGYAAHADRARKVVGGATEAAAAPAASEANAATIAAARARREAAAAETVARARAPVAEPVVASPPTASPAPAPAAPVVAPFRSERGETYEVMMRRLNAERAARLAEYDARMRAERAALDPQFIADDAVSVVPPPPAPQFIPDDALALVADPIPPRVRRQPIQGIVIQPPAPRGAPAAPPQVTVQPTVQAKGTTTMATNLGGAARPGPPPTPPDQIEAALRASLEAGKKQSPGAVRAADHAKTKAAEKVVAEISELAEPRIQVGAEKVGRQVGMTKEQVRIEAGPVLDEVRGEASPILPKKALESIVAKMKTIPPAEREAYVAKATSGKALWQIENIRRTLEALGLLVPVGLASATMGNEE